MTMTANVDIDSDVVLGQCDVADALSARQGEAPAFSFAAHFMNLSRVDRLRSESATQQFNGHAPAQFSQTQKRATTCKLLLATRYTANRRARSRYPHPFPQGSKIHGPITRENPGRRAQ